MKKLFKSLLEKFESFKRRHYIDSNGEFVAISLFSIILVLFVVVGPLMLIRLTLDSSRETSLQNFHEFCEVMEIDCDKAHCLTDGTCHMKLDNELVRVECSTFESGGCYIPNPRGK